MDPSDIIAQRCNEITARIGDRDDGRPVGLPDHDRIIYYVLSIRSELDFGGFESVFEQLLTEAELTFVIDALTNLQLVSLADAFRRTYQRLHDVGFYDGTYHAVQEFQNSDGTGLLDDIERELSDGDPLWAADEQLAKLLDKNAT